VTPALVFFDSNIKRGSIYQCKDWLSEFWLGVFVALIGLLETKVR